MYIFFCILYKIVFLQKVLRGDVSFYKMSFYSLSQKLKYLAAVEIQGVTTC